MTERRPPYHTARDIILPWPDSRLSPNGRKDRRSITAVRRSARETGFYVTKEAGLQVEPVSLEMTVIFMPPNRLRRDLDGMFSSMKSYIDGIFAALGIDDSLVNTVHLLRGPVSTPGFVKVRLEPCP